LIKLCELLTSLFLLHVCFFFLPAYGRFLGFFLGAKLMNKSDDWTQLDNNTQNP